MKKSESQNISRRCPECGSKFIVNDEYGESACSQCGLVLDNNMMDMGPDWRAFNPEERAAKSRAGPPVSIRLPDKGLPTTISKGNRDFLGRGLSPEIQTKTWRMRKWQARTAQFVSNAERNLIQALAELDRISDKLHIPEEIQDEAARIYRQALNRHLVRGRSISTIIAASLYAACRTFGRQRTLKEITSVTCYRKKDIARSYRLLLRELPLKMPIQNPRTYIAKIATKANLPEKVQKVAIQLLDKAEKIKATTGKEPMGLAAAALYTACEITGIKLTQKSLADYSGVTEVTVRNRYKGIKDSLKLGI